jgi:NAD(P)-dependent dehydrogenase (short-subunit alcohol dehydrogenase family)
MVVSVVTGSSTGIGYATALRLARDGHQVVATMRTPEACDLAAVATEQGLDLEVHPLDVTDQAQVDEVFSGVLERLGQIDVLVNNAGVGSGGVLEETELDAYREVMDVNFFGALRCTKAVLPSMREGGRGCIVNVSSQAGRIAMPTMGAYCASKHALEAAMEALAIEVAPFGIRVALVQPGMILTPIWGKVDMTPPTGPYKPIRNRLGAVVMQEMTQGSPPEEVADCIAEVISTGEPRLRWPVGRGAERNLTNRSAWTDEEWSELWSLADNEAFMQRVFASELGS